MRRSCRGEQAGRGVETGSRGASGRGEGGAAAGNEVA